MPPGSQTKLLNTDSISDIRKKLIQLNSEAIYDSLIHIDSVQIQMVVRAITCAEKILIFADGCPSASADFLHHLLLSIGILTHEFSDVKLAAMAATQLTSRDIILFIRRTGEGDNINQILELAQKSGATIISITSNINSRLAKKSWVCLCYSSRIENDLLHLHTARICELAVIGLIQSVLINQMPAEKLRNLLECKKAIIQRNVLFQKKTSGNDKNQNPIAGCSG
jgi:DNA-binding MurR/RpiR family transcriptional regulator